MVAEPIITSSPFMSSPRSRPQVRAHDSLHMMEGLVNCWCMCPRCWQAWPEGRGVCTCRQCPCAASYKATFAMYVPHGTST